jgi:tetratricopeptide (TPR) repeat protein/DNA-binding winged helix-turn-helix (wHTH) protein
LSAQDEQDQWRFRAGDLVLDPGRRVVTVDGQPVKLARLSYRLLEALMEAAPDLVSTDELIQRVWNGRIVSPETITQRVKLVRKALGDDAREPKYVGLVWGEGYRMLAPVERTGPDQPSFSTSLLSELGRRHVVQVALLYAAVAWSITEVVSFLLEALPVFPVWSKSLVAILFVVGFPVAMFLAWRFDIAPGGIRRTEASTTRGRMTIAAAIMLMLGATAGLFYLIYPSISERQGVVAERPYTQAPFREDAVAVLPFRLASNDPDDAYMSEGVAYELRASLGRVGGLQIAAETSSTAFRGQNVLAQDIASRLGVGRLVEGNLTVQGEAVRLSVQIIDGVSGLQIWSKPYDGTVASLLDLSQQVATDVAGELSGVTLADSAAPDPITDSEFAFDLLLQARHLEQKVRDEQIVDMAKQQRVIELYEQAIAADPNSAIAHSRLASAHLYIGDVDSARDPIFRAVTLDSELSEVQYTLGQFSWLMNQELAGEAFREAVRLDPENADAVGALASWLLAQGDPREAGKYYRQALSLDQQSLERYRDLGGYYGATGQRDLTLQLAQDIQLRFDGVRAYQVLARMYEQTGDVDVAIAWVRRAAQREPDNAEFKWQLAELYSRIGDADTANFLQPDPGLAQLYWQRRYDELIDAAELAMLEFPNELPVRYLLGFALHVEGRNEQAIDVLESSGLPHRAYSSSRFAPAVEALATLAGAYRAVGRDEEADEAADFILDYSSRAIDGGVTEHYWPYLYGACAESIKGNRRRALDFIGDITRTSELVWEPVLRDAPCFQPFADHPDYLAVLQEFERRKRDLREKLPDTLERFSDIPADAQNERVSETLVE